MMLKDDNKKHVAIIIKRMKGVDGMDKESIEESMTNENGDEMESSAKDHAVDAMMNAVKRDDREQFKSALKSFVQMCMTEYDD